MNDKELRDIFKYKKYRLSSDNSIFYFELSHVFKDGDYVGDYLVKNKDGEFTIVFDPINLGPFQNIWVITENGDKMLFNQLTSKLKTGDTITLTQIKEEQIPISIKRKLDKLTKKIIGE
jgi:hypothetical protein